MSSPISRSCYHFSPRSSPTWSSSRTCSWSSSGSGRGNFRSWSLTAFGAVQPRQVRATCGGSAGTCERRRNLNLMNTAVTSRVIIEAVESVKAFSIIHIQFGRFFWNIRRLSARRQMKGSIIINSSSNNRQQSILKHQEPFLPGPPPKHPTSSLCWLTETN